MYRGVCSGALASIWLQTQAWLKAGTLPLNYMHPVLVRVSIALIKENS